MPRLHQPVILNLIQDRIRACPNQTSVASLRDEEGAGASAIASQARNDGWGFNPIDTKKAACIDKQLFILLRKQINP